MKKLIFCLILATISLTSTAEVKRIGDTFKIEQTSTASQGKKTKYTWEDKKGKTYPIYITKRGACYILRTSKKTGKEYKYYLPKDVQAQIKQELGINE